MDFYWDDGNFDGNFDGNLMGIFDDGFNGIQWLSLVYPGVWHWLFLPCYRFLLDVQSFENTPFIPEKKKGKL